MFSLTRDPYKYREKKRKKDKRHIFKEKVMRSIKRLDQRSANLSEKGQIINVLGFEAT